MCLPVLTEVDQEPHRRKKKVDPEELSPVDAQIEKNTPVDFLCLGCPTLGGGVEA